MENLLFFGPWSLIQKVPFPEGVCFWAIWCRYYCSTVFRNYFLGKSIYYSYKWWCVAIESNCYVIVQKRVSLFILCSTKKQYSKEEKLLFNENLRTELKIRLKENKMLSKNMLSVRKQFGWALFRILIVISSHVELFVRFKWSPMILVGASGCKFLPQSTFTKDTMPSTLMITKY